MLAVVVGFVDSPFLCNSSVLAFRELLFQPQEVVYNLDEKDLRRGVYNKLLSLQLRTMRSLQTEFTNLYV